MKRSKCLVTTYFRRLGSMALSWFVGFRPKMAIARIIFCILGWYTDTLDMKLVSVTFKNQRIWKGCIFLDPFFTHHLFPGNCATHGSYKTEVPLGFSSNILKPYLEWLELVWVGTKQARIEQQPIMGQTCAGHVLVASGGHVCFKSTREILWWCYSKSLEHLQPQRFWMSCFGKTEQWDQRQWKTHGPEKIKGGKTRGTPMGFVGLLWKIAITWGIPQFWKGSW